MSSLLQSRGRVSKDGKVELFLYLVKKGAKWYESFGRQTELGMNPSPDCTIHADYAGTRKSPNHEFENPDPLYRIWRKPKGMCGCWVVFQWNGEEHVPDLSVPTAVFKLPRDAERLTDKEADAYWSRY